MGKERRRNSVTRSKQDFVPEASNTTERPEATNIPIKEILQDESFQVRKNLDNGIIKRYASVYKAGDAMPPVTVARIGQGLVLVDGWHRIAALKSLGCPEVSAVIKEATEAEARWMAAKANTEHGLQLKSSELRAVFRVYVRAGKYRGVGQGKPKSYRQIASELGGQKSYSTIRNWMKKDFRRISKQYGNEEPQRGQGGLPDTHTGNHFVMTARAALDDALTAFRCVDDDPYQRGELIEHTERILTAMKDGKPWESPDF